MSVTLDVPEKEPIAGLLPDGKPDPAYAAALGLVPASAGRRSAAFAIDAAFYALLALPMGIGAAPAALRLMADPDAVSAGLGHPDLQAVLLWSIISQTLIVVYVLVQLIVHGLRGVTAGKAIVGIRSVNARTFEKPGFWRMVLRAFVVGAASVIVPLIGALVFLLSPLWDRERRGRGWHDHIGGNWIIDRRHGVDPFDAKALRMARRRLNAPHADEVQMPSLATSASDAVRFAAGERSRAAVVGAEAPDHSGAPAPTAAPPPVRPGYVTPPPMPPRAPDGAVLVGDDGARYELTGTTLIGRRPEPRAGENISSAIAIDDPSFSMSKTHALVGIEPDGIWIEDRGSSNGSAVVPPSGQETALVPEERAHAPWGSRVHLGERSFLVKQFETAVD
ncbi:putative RDD family membrane protein YckC [Diaminobutyricimonas aerilata]|uniref:Putative RDD family membrane protein YckC n=1 Tax=Diaminobutyricimonas aerilata TaxID=1162967 RepID=A0A2M9CN16_9MICO|nr:RDD family protein [Diaminobutyricimonas aerilata]PJJ73268.1 putative RDD family membrane protein YckC [Diaminobutyricimonas aerilata]